MLSMKKKMMTMSKMVDGGCGRSQRPADATISTTRPLTVLDGRMVEMGGTRMVFWQPCLPFAHNAPVMNGGG
jgi:hypothetical protein